MVMDLDHQIRTLGDRPRTRLVVSQRDASRSPAADERGALESRSAETRIVPIRRSELTGGAIRIQEDQRMMHNAAIIRAELEAVRIGVPIQIQRNHEALESIGAVGR